ncbi:hypothetical protein [Alkalihalobacterium chitinilyticum]|uniref:P/Homo B domain-containing protein n=1 Tax=Alkalihalobacterium chitinilyticum TaxID=2980103 RepID=A0ABT5VEM5_9BACI|nr:hypothetical protein [Alkalihalobacterium chitinilyticum]MDE5412664.1 hypothetical protein [Alkalihalobacterium chitinilyticum]
MEKKELQRLKEERQRKHKEADRVRAADVRPLQATPLELASAIVSPATLTCLTDAALDAVSPLQAEVFTFPLQGFPTNGDAFAVLSSGIAGEANESNIFCSTCFESETGPVGFDTVSLNLTFNLPQNPGNLIFNWKFATREFPPTFFNDYFDVLVNGTSITDFPITVNNAVLSLPAANDVCYSRITPTIQTATFDLSPFAGQTITVTFRVSDVGDCVLDTAAFIDNVRIEGCEARIAVDDAVADMEQALSEALNACTTPPAFSIEECLLAITNKEIVLQSFLETSRDIAVPPAFILAAAEVERALAAALRACIAQGGDIERCVTLITKKETVLQFLMDTLRDPLISQNVKASVVSMEQSLAAALRACIDVGGDVERCIRLLTKKEIVLQSLLRTARTCIERTTTFSNTAPIAIPETGTAGPAAPYPSPIVVSGLTGPIIKVTVTFNNFSHTFPADIAAMLVGPRGQDTILMAQAGSGANIEDVTLTFDDDAAEPLPIPIVSGTYQPTNNGISVPFPSPAPTPTTNDALSVYIGTDPNGTWELYINDQFLGDTGIMAGGWELHITTCEPVGTNNFNTTQSNCNEERVQQLLQEFHASHPTKEDQKGRKEKLKRLQERLGGTI